MEYSKLVEIYEIAYHINIVTDTGGNKRGTGKKVQINYQIWDHNADNGIGKYVGNILKPTSSTSLSPSTLKEVKCPIKLLISLDFIFITVNPLGGIFSDAISE